MKVLITLTVLSVVFLGLAMTTGAQEAIDLSTLGKKPMLEPISIPSTTYDTAALVLDQLPASGRILDLSTLGKTSLRPAIPPVVLEGPTPITVTPSFSIKNANITSIAKTVVTPAHALAGPNINFLRPNVTVYTPPIAIFGGA